MKLKVTLTALVFSFRVLLAQVNGTHVPGATCTNCPSKNGSGLSVMNGASVIATSYTMSACGLNYKQASIDLHQRYITTYPTPGATQPATISISGIPPCRTIVKAFLYVGTIGNGVPITVALQSGNAVNYVPMTVIGTDVSVCWGTAGTYAYRADVTTLVQGNGTYTISGIPVSPSLNDAEGATLLIIYSDLTQSYTGNIVIADGCQVTTNTNGVYSDVTGFNICGTPSLTSNFMLVADLQGIASSYLSLNTSSATPNYTKTAASDQIWDYVTAPGAPAVANQTTATYGISSGGGDCMALIMAGMYYRSACLTCTLASALSVSVTSTSACPGGATISVGGGTAPYTYSWTGSAQTSSVVNGLSAGSYTVKVNDTYSCNSGTATFALTNPAASVSVNTPPPVCAGYSVGLIASPATSYTWNPGINLNSSSASSVVATPTSSTIYSLSVTDAFGCIGTTTVNVVINPNPVPAIVSNSVVCENGNLPLNGSGGNAYQWSGPNGFSSNQQNPVLNNVSVLAGGIYSLTVSLNTCSLTVTKNVTVSPRPVIIPNYNAPACTANNLQLNCVNTGGVSYLWAGPASFTSSLQNPVITQANLSNSGIYQVTVTSNAGCQTYSTINVAILPGPTLSTINSSVCTGQSASISVSGASTYTWTGPNNFSGNSQSAVFPVSSASIAGIYTVVATGLNSCMANTTLGISLNPLPVLASLSASVCYGQAANLSVSGAASYSWTGPGYNGTGATVIIPMVNNLTAGSYTATGTGTNGCIATATANLYLYPLPVLTIPNVSVCYGQSATLNGTGASTYSWFGPANYFFSGANAFIPLTNNLTVGAYTVMGTSANSCSNLATVMLSAFPLPQISVSSSTVCFSQPITLTASGALSYSWTSPTGSFSNTPSYFISSANYTAPVVFTVTGMDVNSCVNSKTAVLQALPLPSVSASSGKKLICRGESLILTAGGAQTYSWLPSGQTTYTVVVAPSITTNYTVQGTALNGCTSTATVSAFVNVCAGIHEMKAVDNEILVYPNPNSGNFIVASETAMHLLLVNTLGQNIKIIELDEKNNYSAAFSEIAEGVYYLISKDKSLSRKIIIEK